MSSYVRLCLVLCVASSSGVVDATQRAEPDKDPTHIERSEPPKKAERPPLSVGTRGELLYENHCIGCHTSRAHVRDNRRAKSESEVEGWVRRWANELTLGWSQDEVNQVTSYLVRRYYKFDSTENR